MSETHAEEETRLRAELAEIEAEHQAIKHRRRTLRDRLDEIAAERRHAEALAHRREQAQIAHASWLRYVAGESPTLRVGTIEGAECYGEVAPAARAGEWIVHSSLPFNDGVYEYAYALTHGPSGMLAMHDNDREWLTSLAREIAEVVPTLTLDEACSSAAETPALRQLAAIVRRARAERET